MRLRVTHSPLRVGLYTLTLGLAFVWMHNAFLIGSSVVPVELPEARSADILPVFIERSRFVNRGGGSGPHGPNVSLREVESRLAAGSSFRLDNYLEEPIFLPRRLIRTSQVLIPYFLQCQDKIGGPIYVVPTAFEFDTSPIELKPRQSLFLTVPFPYSARNCVVIVPYAYSEAAATSIAEQNPFKARTEDDFIDRFANWAGVNGAFEISEPRDDRP